MTYTIDFSVKKELEEVSKKIALKILKESKNE